MLNELALARHFVFELLTRNYDHQRVPEPCLVMDTEANVREFRDGGKVDGSVAPVYLFNLLLLAGSIPPGSVVVDLGCGPANLLVELAGLVPSAKFIGVDLSSEMLRFAEELRDSRGLENLDFRVSDITELAEFGADSADLVMSTLSLHHLPQADMLNQCLRQVARVVRPGGHIHLMDFASLKRKSTTDYFATERSKNLGDFLALDYRNSLFAAYRVEDLNQALSEASEKLARARLRQTFAVPFMMALTTLTGAGPLSFARQAALRAYWRAMRPAQRADFDALRLFFRIGGLAVPHPRALAG